jgi:catechol 2,3-dioxygenase
VTVRDSAQLSGARLDPATSIGSVALRVVDLERSRAFYTHALGMTELGEGVGGALALGGPDGHVLLELTGDPEATPRDPRQTGLFHLAVLVPSRADLARSLYGIAATRVPLNGASDHLVSEALYLHDPDGNGIEIYRDRPRADWPRDASGTIEMATLALDLDDLIRELAEPPSPAPGLAAGTVIGHVHLQVAAIGDVERFYATVLGFDVTVSTYPGALFVSAGGYHHHIGLNTWNSRGGSAPGPRSVGLASYGVHVGSETGLAAVLGRVRAAGLETVEDGASGEVLVSDPAGNRVRLYA